MKMIWNWCRMEWKVDESEMITNVLFRWPDFLTSSKHRGPQQPILFWNVDLRSTFQLIFSNVERKSLSQMIFWNVDLRSTSQMIFWNVDLRSRFQMNFWNVDLRSTFRMIFETWIYVPRFKWFFEMWIWGSQEARQTEYSILRRRRSMKCGSLTL